MGLKELLRAGDYHPGQQTDLKRVLRELLREGSIRKDGKRFLVPVPGEPGAPLTPNRSGPWKQAPQRSAEAPARPARTPRDARTPREARPPRDARTPRDARAPRDARTPPREVRAPAVEGARDLRTPREPRDRAPSSRVVQGQLRMHREGYGFVHPATGGGDNIFIPAFDAQKALDGDTVQVEVRGPAGRLEGRLIDVVRRRRELAVGTYHVRGKRAWVEPQDAKLGGVIRVPITQLAQDGDVVKVILGAGADLLDVHEGLTGEVSGSMGRPGHPSSEVLSIAFAQGFSDEFPEEVMAEAEAFKIRVTEKEATGEQRRDLRSLRLITIDGEDARDFDDAVFAEPHPRGYRLVVAIADVTHYVREGTDLDTEALHRATSVYLPDRVLPMLPERLSNGICSLRPDEDRLCMVADLVIDRAGKRLETDVYPGVMRSAARCTYNEVQAVLDGEDLPHRNAFKPDFERLDEVAGFLRAMRKKRGAIDFDLKETKIIVGEDGYPERVELRERLGAHRLIEECMLAANEAVAHFFHERGLPTVYRFHDEPNEEKVAAFIELAGAHGFTFTSGKGLPSSVELNNFLEALAGHAEQRTLNQLLLRSMMQAVYSSENMGHYGLAAEHYLHFTSPIRRYPDLLVHRLLKAHWRRDDRKRPEHELDAETDRLEGMAVQSSERERAAMMAEREVSQFYVCLLMKDRIGEVFDATVASLTDFGFFIELDEVHVEGIVRADTLGPGVRLDTLHHMMVWPGGRKVRVGNKLTARLVSINDLRRQLELEVEAFAEEPAPAKVRPGASRRKAAAEELAAPEDRKPRVKRTAGDRKRAAPIEAPTPVKPPTRAELTAERAAPVRGVKGKSRLAAGEREEKAARPTAAKRGAAERETRPARALERKQPEPQAPAADSFRHRPAFVPPGAEAAPTASAASPHPGFDRLRALASHGRSAERAAPPQGSRRPGQGKSKSPGGGTKKGPAKGRGRK